MILINVNWVRMKALILAGGQGTRLREETEYRPKPIVYIGSKPILWHIMKIFHAQGVSDFDLALAEDELGWRVITSLESGLKHSVALDYPQIGVTTCLNHVESYLNSIQYSLVKYLHNL